MTVYRILCKSGLNNNPITKPRNKRKYIRYDLSVTFQMNYSLSLLLWIFLFRKIIFFKKITIADRMPFYTTGSTGKAPHSLQNFPDHGKQPLHSGHLLSHLTSFGALLYFRNVS